MYLVTDPKLNLWLVDKSQKFVSWIFLTGVGVELEESWAALMEVRISLGPNCHWIAGNRLKLQLPRVPLVCV